MISIVKYLFEFGPMLPTEMPKQRQYNIGGKSVNQSEVKSKLFSNGETKDYYQGQNVTKDTRFGAKK